MSTLVIACIVMILLIFAAPFAMMSFIMGTPGSREVGGTWPLFIVSRGIPVVWAVCLATDVYWLIRLIGERL